MNLIAWFHQFLFQIEENFSESRLFLRQRKHSLIDYLESQSGADALAFLIGHVKTHSRFAARQIARCVRDGMYVQLLGRLYEDQPLIQNLAAIPAYHITSYRQRSAHRRCGNQVQLRFSALNIHIASKNSLSFMYKIDVRCPGLTRRKNRNLNSVTRLDHPMHSPHQQLVLSSTRLEAYRLRGATPLLIIGFDP